MYRFEVFATDRTPASPLIMNGERSMRRYSIALSLLLILGLAFEFVVEPRFDASRHAAAKQVESETSVP